MAEIGTILNSSSTFTGQSQTFCVGLWTPTVAWTSWTDITKEDRSDRKSTCVRLSILLKKMAKSQVFVFALHQDIPESWWAGDMFSVLPDTTSMLHTSNEHFQKYHKFYSWRKKPVSPQLKEKKSQKHVFLNNLCWIIYCCRCVSLISTEDFFEHWKPRWLLGRQPGLVPDSLSQAWGIEDWT